MNFTPFVTAILCCCSSAAMAQAKPNVVLIFADDMGIGDVSHAGGKAATPALDRIAKEGIQFTNAHTTSSVCTPSRYSLITGRYSWRTRLQKGAFGKPRDNSLIKQGEETVASLLQDNGYNTGCVGKWHMGFTWQYKKDFERQPGQGGLGWDVDYSKPAITPTSHGFDYFYGIQASLDMAPYIYIENDKAIGDVSVMKAFHRKGAAHKDFEANQCLRVFAEKSVEYIDRVAKDDKPFFLYVPLTSPHTPIVPSKRWQGQSGLGRYGDFLMETDWVVGEILKALDKHGVTDDTLIFFSTDNGASPAAGLGQLKKKGHKANGDLRGHKADVYQGGHNVPTIAMWPKVIKAGSQTTRLTSLADFYATCAEMVGAEIKPQSAVDSVSFYQTLLDPSKGDRSAIVMHSVLGAFAIRDGNWKLCFCGGSGGWSGPRKRPTGAPKWQLFNLESDPAEKKNLYLENPEKVKELHELMVKYIEDGRSTPGPVQPNDAAIVLDKENPK